MIGIRADTTGLRIRLTNMTSALTDLRPAWAKVHQVVIEMIKANFETQGGRASIAWPALSPSYAAWKMRRFGEKPLLRATDRLFKSLTDPKHSEHVAIMTPRTAEFGTSVSYAKFHQTGTGNRRGRTVGVGVRQGIARSLQSRRAQSSGGGMPPRPPIPPLTQEDGAAIVDIMLEHTLKAARD